MSIENGVSALRSFIQTGAQSEDAVVLITKKIESTEVFKKLREKTVYLSEEEKLALIELQANNDAFPSHLSLALFDLLHRYDLPTGTCQVVIHNIPLTEDNVLSLLHHAYLFDDKPLLRKCLAFIRENASRESFPVLLEKGKEIKLPELIWTALQLGMGDRYTFYSVGKIRVDHYSEDLASLLKEISPFVPISLEINKPISDEDLDLLARECPFVEHLVLSSSITKQQLERFTNLKSFGNSNLYLRSLEGADAYQESISPLFLSVLNLKYMDFKQDHLEQIASKYPNLKQLFIHSSNMTTAISFENLEVLECEHCIWLKSLNVPNAYRVIATGCTHLTSLIAQNAIAVDINDCRALCKLNVPYALRVFAGGTGLEILHAPNAKIVYRDGSHYLKTLVAPHAEILTQLKS